MVTGLYRTITDGYTSNSPADDTAGLTNMFLTANSTGGAIILEPKTYNIATALPTLKGTVNVIGYGSSSLIQYTGPNPGSAVDLFSVDGTGLTSITTYATYNDFTVKVQDNPDNTAKRLQNVTCIKFRNLANINITNILGRGGLTGIELDGVLSSTATRINSNGNYYGVLVHNTAGDVSSCNEVTLIHPSVGQNWQGGIKWQDGAPNIVGGNFEGNGISPIEGANTGFGLKVIRDSNQNGLMPNGLNLYGGYFEVNHGTADIWIQHNEVANIAWFIEGSNFNRVGTSFCTNNIRLDNSQNAYTGLTVFRTTHNDAGGYVHSVNNKYGAYNFTGTGTQAKNVVWLPSYQNQGIEVPNFPFTSWN